MSWLANNGKIGNSLEVQWLRIYDSTARARELRAHMPLGVAKKQNEETEEWKKPGTLRVVILAWHLGLPTSEVLFVIEKYAFTCLSHWYLTFVLYAKISPNSLLSTPFKICQILLLLSSTTPTPMASHLTRNKVHTIIKLLIPSLTLPSSFTLLQLFCEYTSDTPASRPLHIMPFAWNILPPDIHVSSSLISFSLWENVNLLERTCHLF